MPSSGRIPEKQMYLKFMIRQKISIQNIMVILDNQLQQTLKNICSKIFKVVKASIDEAEKILHDSQKFS